MESKTYSIPKIMCDHCVNAIKTELDELAGVAKVEGDPEKKEISVQWDAPATDEKIRSVLKEINYPAAG